MGNVQAPDSQPDGSNTLRHHNGSNLFSMLRIQAGTSAKQQLVTAGFGCQIVAADGVTVLLDIPETGFVPPASTFVQLTPQASAPSGITEGAIWYSSVDHAWHGLDNGGDVTFVNQ